MSTNKTDHKSRKIVLPLIAGLIFLFGLFSFRAAPDSRLPASPPKSNDPALAVQFKTDLATGLSAASDGQKPVLLFFAAENCPFSRKMLDETFADPEIRRLSQAFVCVQIDPDTDNLGPLGKDYRVPGTPTVQFLSSEGGDLLQTARFQSAPELKNQMEKVLHSVAWRRENLVLR